MKINRTYIIAVSLFVIGLASLFLSKPAQADQPIIVSQQFPIDYSVMVPCSNNVAVRMNGTLHVTYRAAQDASGGYHIVSNANWQNVTGVNEQTGEVYRFITVGTSSGYSSGNNGSTASNMVTNGAVVSEGEGIILFVHNIYHVTITPDGELAAQFIRQTADCKNDLTAEELQ